MAPLIAFNPHSERWESYRTCPRCGGIGTFGGEPCEECSGEGRSCVEEIDTTEHQYRDEEFFGWSQ